MKHYELALVLPVGLSEEKVKAVIAKISELIKNEKGQLLKETIWPKKALAYPIKKQKEALFVFLNFSVPTLSSLFPGKIKLMEEVLRFLLLKKKGGEDLVKTQGKN